MYITVGFNLTEIYQSSNHAAYSELISSDNLDILHSNLMYGAPSSHPGTTKLGPGNHRFLQGIVGKVKGPYGPTVTYDTLHPTNSTVTYGGTTGVKFGYTGVLLSRAA